MTSDQYPDIAFIRERYLCGQFREAVEAVQAALEISPDDAELLNLAGVCHLALGSIWYPGTVTLFRQAVDETDWSGVVSRVAQALSAYEPASAVIPHAVQKRRAANAGTTN